MAADRYDAIILGAGHNGLVCGTYLAKAGLKVLVLERRHVIGGAAVTEEFSPGFRASIFSYVMSILHPRIIADLELRKFGLEVLPANDLFSPLSATDSIIFSDDVKKTQEQFARFSAKDAAIYPEFDAYLQDFAEIRPQAPLRDPGRPGQGRLARLQGHGPVRLALPRHGRPLLPHPRSAHAVGLRLSLAMVRERHHQGDLRLLRLDRHLRLAQDAGLGLRAAAPPHGRA